MSPFQLRILNAAVRTFPRSHRERDGEMIRDLAIEMVSAGKPVGGQAASLVSAGVAARLRGAGHGSSANLIRHAFMLVAGLVAPVLIATVMATLASTLLLDHPLSDNRLAGGIELSMNWLIHAAIPWSFSIFGCLSAAHGFSSGKRELARVGATLSFVGAWLVIGSMGGWMPGSGFVGPAELPIDFDAAGATSTVYIIAPIGAMTSLMLIASVLMPKDSQVPACKLSSAKLAAVTLISFAVISAALSASATVADLATMLLLGWILAMPLQCLMTRGNELPSGVKPMAVGIELFAFAIPSLLLIDQVLDSMTEMGTWHFSPVVFAVVTAMAFVGIVTIAATLLRSRKRT